MPMTDAPNFGTEFGRRRPCPRYIGPLLGTTSVAPVGRGDHTPPLPRRAPPSVHSRSPRRGRAPSRPVGEGVVSRQFPLVPERLPTSRRGGPMCPPADGSRDGTCPGRHIGRPLQNLRRPRAAGGDRAPPLPEHRKSLHRAAVPKAGPPPTKLPILNSQLLSILNYQLSILYSQFLIPAPLPPPSCAAF